VGDKELIDKKNYKNPGLGGQLTMASGWKSEDPGFEPPRAILDPLLPQKITNNSQPKSVTLRKIIGKAY